MRAYISTQEMCNEEQLMQNADAAILLVRFLKDAHDSEHCRVFKDAAWTLLAGALKELQTRVGAKEKHQVGCSVMLLF